MNAEPDRRPAPHPSWPILQTSLKLCDRCLPRRAGRMAQAALMRLALSWLSLRIDLLSRRLPQD